MSNKDKENKPQTTKQKIIENVTSLGLAIILVFAVRSSVIEAFKIPSGSMIPTLLVGDHIFVNKFAYGFKIPFSDLFRMKPINIIDRDPPKRGDIVVFKYPRDESIYYIKRVVGLPGDSLEIKNKIIYINGKPMGRESITGEAAQKILSSLNDEKYDRSNLDLFEEIFEQGKHTIMIDKHNYLGETLPEIKIPDSHLFVMGDNRDFSNDSRFWGFVPFENVKGKALFIWMSMSLQF